MNNVALFHSCEAPRGRLAAQLREAGLTVRTFAAAEDLLSCIASGETGVVVMDLAVLQVHDGMALLSQCRSLDAAMAVVVLCERSDAGIAIEAVQRGAVDVLTPERMPRLAMVCRQALGARELTLRAQASAAAQPLPSAPGLAPIQEVLRGNHPAIGRLRQALLRLARIDADVLVRGETGSGKEVVARCLHDYGSRAHKPFVAINCGAVPENIFESELFGHEAGAFTGANRRRVGKLEYASGGTVFLDEIESMPPALQVKLLRALQQRSIERVGGNEAIRLNCRVVAATKDDLLELARRGRFRADLYYRINVVELTLPALRERRDDIPQLAHGFAKEAAERHGLAPLPLAPNFVCRLMARDWPGNVRELRNAVERHVLGVDEMQAPGAPQAVPLPELLASFERELIEQCLRMCGGSVTRVCEALGVPRKTLYDKLARLGVEPAAFRDKAGAEASGLGEFSVTSA